MTSIGCALLLCLRTATAFPTRPIGPTFERDEVDMSSARQWVAIESSSCVSFNSIDPFPSSAAYVPGRLTIVQAAAPSEPLPLREISIRASLLFAPLQWVDLRGAYRAFMHLPSGVRFTNGTTYTVTAVGLNTTWNSAPISRSAVFREDWLNTNIRVNQIGFLVNQIPKRAWVGQYAGSNQSGHNVAVDFSRGGELTFEVLDASTGLTVLNGVGKIGEELAFNLTGQTLWELDFSTIVTPGWYRLSVPGVGVGHVFQVSDRVYDQVAAAAQRGAYHARCGCELSRNLTRYARGSCHTSDGTIMPTNPLPQWFEKKFNLTASDMFPEVQRPPGTVSPATHGHHDAGDYSKYTVSGSMFAAFPLLLYENETMAARLARDDGQIPEAHNGIPDILDEVHWELDWLEGMQDPSDGGVYCVVKPNGTIDGWYQKGMPDEPHNNDRILLPKDTTCTGMFAGSLALAARSIAARTFFSAAERARWLQKAEAAWQFLQRHANKPALCYQAYGCFVTTGPGSGCNNSQADGDMSHHARVWAASQLYLATGNVTYHKYFLTQHCPHYRHYTWEPLATGETAGPGYALATMSYALAGTRQLVPVDAEMLVQCRSELRYAAQFYINSTTAYGIMLPEEIISFRQYGWFFPQAKAYTLLVSAAAGVVPDLDDDVGRGVLATWDYLLGGNPTGRSFMTGFGAQRQRSVVDQDSIADGIEPPVSGIPIGMASGPSWVGQYGRAEGVLEPGFEQYPVLAHQFDGFNVNTEFTVSMIAFSMLTSSFFASTATQLGPAVANYAPIVSAVQMNTSYGHVPLAVHFAVNASDPNPGGYISRVVWELDHVENGATQTQSQADSPDHSFTRPYTAYVTGVTVTSSLGKDTFVASPTAVETTPETYPFNPVPAIPDAATIAYVRVEEKEQGFALRDPHRGGNPIDGVFTEIAGSPTLSDSNLLWMENRSGYALAFACANDTITYTLPADKSSAFAANATLSLALKVFVKGSGQGSGTPLGWGHKGNAFGENVFVGFVQDWQHAFGWVAGEWDRLPEGPRIELHSPNATTHSKSVVLLPSEDLSAVMPFGSWYQLELAMTPKDTSFRVDGHVVASTSAYTKFLDGTKPLNITIGGFDGFIDDLILSTEIRPVHDDSHNM